MCSLQDKFASSFGAKATRMVVSPGRVNLIGEHTDYNDGLVCPMAIEPSVQIAFRARSDSKVIVESMQFEGSRVEFDLKKSIEPTIPPHDWSNYIKGIAHELTMAGHKLIGMEAMLSSTLPVGAGLSSSAAVEVGIGTALIHCAELKIDPTDLAQLALRAERAFAGVNVGIMDQMIVANGRRDRAMLLDCRSLAMKFVPIREKDVRIVIVNSMQSHALAEAGDQLQTPDGKVHQGSPYNMRRLACETGVSAMQRNHSRVRALRDATLTMLEEARPALTETIFRRCRHVITEIDRCSKFADLLAKSSYEQAGHLMYASHTSLRNDYEVSTGALDALVEIARSVPGVYGSRLTGAGFGGCTVTLVKSDAVDAFVHAVRERFHPPSKKDVQIIVTRATDGARIVE